MKKYKVIALSLGGKGKLVYDAGDIVTQDNLSASVEELEAKGFIASVDVKKENENIGKQVFDKSKSKDDSKV